MIILALGVTLIILKALHLIGLSWALVLAPLLGIWAWMLIVRHADRIVMRHTRRIQRLRRVLGGRRYTYRAAWRY